MANFYWILTLKIGKLKFGYCYFPKSYLRFLDFSYFYKMTIRLAKSVDLFRINEIYNLSVPTKKSTADIEPTTLAARSKWFEKHNKSQSPVFVAEIENTVVGWISLSSYRPGRGALRTISEVSYYIHPDFHNQGIGSKLMEFIIESSPNFNIKNLIAILMEHNTGSINLLKKFGFEEWGRLKKVAVFDGKEYDHLYYGVRI